MRSTHRLERLEKKYRTRLDTCPVCGKSTEDWSYSLIVHVDHDHPDSTFHCLGCRRHSKIFVFDDDLYQQELRKTKPKESRIRVL